MRIQRVRVHLATTESQKTLGTPIIYRSMTIRTTNDNNVFARTKERKTEKMRARKLTIEE